MNDFARRWNDYAVRVGLTYRQSLFTLPAPDARLSPATSEFLTQVGLPDGSWEFDELPKHGLQRVYELYDPTRDWGEAERERLRPYLVLGYNGGGDALCLNYEDESIAFSWHECEFKIGQAFNSSVQQLAECILIFREMIEAFQNQFPDAEIYEGRVPDWLLRQTLEKMARVDAIAVEEGSEWLIRLDGI